VLIRARAPLRISFSGGGTDLGPYMSEYGGLVLNATIDRYAYATLRLHPDPIIRVNSRDFKTVAHYGFEEPLVYNGSFDLIKACLKRLPPVPESDGRGIELYLETDAPPGSGLGASSALVVAVIGALRTWRRVPLDKYEVARIAWEVERKDVGIAGGMQDQYAAVFGGFNLIEFHGERNVVVNPLRIEPRIIHELQYNMLLIFTGTTRLSSQIIESQLLGVRNQEPGVIDALHRMKALTIEAKDALLTGRLRDLAEILHQEFLEKRRTASAIATPLIDEMYEEARRLGVIGGKVSGAGGGGFMFLYCPFDRKPAVIERISEMGGQTVPMAFEHDGMQSWAADDESSRLVEPATTALR
jgi:D-glycero-alpha-D-manno-heptose-7-phosphate kinase